MVDTTVSEARERWEREHQGKVDEAVGLAKQVTLVTCNMYNVHAVFHTEEGLLDFPPSRA